jgi:hypothetical protein
LAWATLTFMFKMIAIPDGYVKIGGQKRSGVTHDLLSRFNTHFNRIPFQVPKAKKLISARIHRHGLRRHSAVPKPLSGLFEILRVEDDVPLFRSVASPQLYERKKCIVI